MNYKELYDYINILFKQYFWKYHLNEDDKNDAIQDVIIKLYLKELDGVLSPSIKENKNYIFITLKNQLNQIKRINKRYSSKDIDDIETTPDIPDFFVLMNYQQERNILLSIIDDIPLTARETLVLPRVMDGMVIGEIEKDINMEKKHIYSTINNFKEKVRHKFDPNTFKYKLTMYDNGQVYFFKTLKQLLEKTRISPDTWQSLYKLGKFKHKKFEITIL